MGKVTDKVVFKAMFNSVKFAEAVKEHGVISKPVVAILGEHTLPIDEM